MSDSTDQPTVGGHFQAPQSRSFGDPDQALYGGTGELSPAPDQDEPTYRGRHRATD
jgi:hypothetical protein